MKWLVGFLLCYIALLITGLPGFIFRYNKSGIFITLKDFYQLLPGAILLFLLVVIFSKFVNHKKNN